jgi:enoyl-CoA hydratase/carnithine racemase
MTLGTFDVERDDALALVTIKRPRVLDALDSHTLELRRAVSQFQWEAPVHEVILTAAQDARTS